MDPSAPLPPVQHGFAQFRFVEHQVTECDPKAEMFITGVRHEKPVKVDHGKMQAFYPVIPQDQEKEANMIDWTCGEQKGQVRLKRGRGW